MALSALALVAFDPGVAAGITADYTADAHVWDDHADDGSGPPCHQGFVCSDTATFDAATATMHLDASVEQPADAQPALAELEGLAVEGDSSSAQGLMYVRPVLSQGRMHAVRLSVSVDVLETTANVAIADAGWSHGAAGASFAVYGAYRGCNGEEWCSFASVYGENVYLDDSGIASLPTGIRTYSFELRAAPDAEVRDVTIIVNGATNVFALDRCGTCNDGVLATAAATVRVASVDVHPLRR